MLHQLNIAQKEPRAAFLASLYKDGIAPVYALHRIASFHCGMVTTDITLRRNMQRTQEGFYPHPTDIKPLLYFYLKTLRNLLKSSSSVQEDFLAAAFAFYGLLAIQPFEARNGRIAEDFVQYLLMVRLQSNSHILKLPNEAHECIKRVFAPLDKKQDSTTFETMFASSKFLARTLNNCNIELMKNTPAFMAVAGWLMQSAGIQPSFGVKEY